MFMCKCLLYPRSPTQNVGSACCPGTGDGQVLMVLPRGLAEVLTLVREPGVGPRVLHVNNLPSDSRSAGSHLD